MDFKILIENAILAASACVGLIEVLKSFFKTEKKWIYAIIMIPLSIGCYAAVLYLPSWVIGGLFTIAISQICYQTIIQTFQTLVKTKGKKTVETVENIQETKDEKKDF